MSLNKEIIVEIDENGNCSIEGKNFAGPECERHIRELQQKLGQLQTSSRTHEYQQKTTHTRRTREMSG